jgi:tRNA nucleotidyltransferase/poly(A) polymerase
MFGVPSYQNTFDTSKAPIFSSLQDYNKSNNLFKEIKNDNNIKNENSDSDSDSVSEFADVLNKKTNNMNNKLNLNTDLNTNLNTIVDIKKDETNNKILEELNVLKKKIEKIDKLESELNDFKCKSPNNITEKIKTGVYVYCRLHNHFLRETLVIELDSSYYNGFMCDNCNYQQKDINEKFYQCGECNSEVSKSGNFDLCSHCVVNNL